jgi:hypothetical protein
MSGGAGPHEDGKTGALRRSAGSDRGGRGLPRVSGLAAAGRAARGRSPAALEQVVGGHPVGESAAEVVAVAEHGRAGAGGE